LTTNSNNNDPGDTFLFLFWRKLNKDAETIEVTLRAYQRGIYLDKGKIFCCKEQKVFVI
jgi:hypothetical protein